jgi:AAA15 family ATPase/GTPase
MYHFTHFNIHQFRGFRNFNLDNLGRVNLLVGMNNAGKTSVLEAISLYCRSFDLRAWIETSSLRNMRQFAPSKFEAVKWFFPKDSQTEEENSEILMKAQGHFKVRAVRASFKEENVNSFSMNSGFLASELDIDQDNEALLQNAVINVSRLYSPNMEESLCEDTSRFVLREKGNKFETGMESKVNETGKFSIDYEYTLPVSTIIPCSHELKGIKVIKQITQTKTEGRIKHLINIIRKIDPNIENLEILSQDGRRLSVYLQHQKMGLAPITLFGDGVQRILDIALSLLNVQNGILLIDELEVGIHTSALQTVFTWLVETCREYNIQLFATTHSLEALDAVLATVPEDSDEIVSYRLPNPITGGQVKRFGGHLLQRLRYERGLDVR